MRSLISIAIVLAMSGNSVASELSASCPVRWMPPRQYDHVPDVLPVEFDLDYWDVDAKCRQPTNFATREMGGGRYTGCALHMKAGYWEIVVVKTGSQGVDAACHDLLVRHEWGHVNGWGEGHEGAVPAEDATPMV